MSNGLACSTSSLMLDCPFSTDWVSVMESGPNWSIPLAKFRINQKKDKISLRDSHTGLIFWSFLLFSGISIGTGFKTWSGQCFKNDPFVLILSIIAQRHSPLPFAPYLASFTYKTFSHKPKPWSKAEIIRKERKSVSGLNYLPRSSRHIYKAELGSK